MEIKSIYKASFEESTQLVTDKLVDANMNNTAPKIVKKRVIGMIVTIFLSIGCYFYLDFILGENEFFFRLIGKSQLYLLIMLIIGIYQVNTLFDMNKKRYRLSIIYNRSIYAIILVLGSLHLAFGLDIVENFFLKFIYIIILVIIIYLINKKINIKIKGNMFNEQQTKTIGEKLEGKWKVSQKIGSTIVLIAFIWNLFFGSSSERSEWMTTLLINLSPLLFIFFIIIVFFFKSYFIEGYYIEKYPEEYRLKYGYSNKDWYGEKSKQYKQAKANGKEE